MFRGWTPRRLGPVPRPPSDRLPGKRALPLIYRDLGEGGSEGAANDPSAREAPLAMLEAILLIADEPLPVRKLVQASGLPDAAAVRRHLKRLQALYDQDQSAFQLEELAGGFQLMTRTEFHRWLGSMGRNFPDMKLSAPARETLAIVAYRQPIMRADIEAIRGVHCGETLRLLMEKGLVKIAGRDNSLGRPVLYATTKRFLQVFGLRNLKDLPTVAQLRPPEANDA